MLDTISIPFQKRHSVDDICLADIVIEGREWEPPTKGTEINSYERYEI